MSKQDFGRHGEFLEESVKHILKYDPESLAYMGVLKSGEFSGTLESAEEVPEEADES